MKVRYSAAFVFAPILCRMGQALTASEAEDFMREADTNGDGKLDYDEFARIMSQSISKQLRYDSI